MNRLPPRFGRPPDEQSSMPSQHESEGVTGVPFSPVNQPDVRQPFKTLIGQQTIANDPDAAGSQVGLEMSDVRHVYDSRPPRAFDWYFQDKFDAVGADPIVPVVPTSQLGGFTVPVGYVLIVRGMVVSFYGESTAMPDNLDIYGNSVFNAGNNPQLSVVIDGVSTSFWTPIPSGANGIELFDALANVEIHIPCFILVGSGQNFNVRPFIPDNWGVNGDPFAFDIFLRYYGTLMLETGRDLINEVGNQYPEPVTIVEG